MGFDGSYRTVCNFIQEWKEARSQTEGGRDDKSYERLSHPPAEAQRDYGLMEAVKDGKYIDVHCLVMTLPFSNSGFAIPLPAEKQDCRLDGMRRAVEQRGGVDKNIG